MTKIISIPADLMKAAVAEVRHLERFAGMPDAEIIQALLKAGTNKVQQ